MDICAKNEFLPLFQCKEILQTLMALRKSFKVHVTFGDSKRILTLNKGEGVPELRYNFLREFSDELSDDVPPTNIKFQRYNETFNDYEDLKLDAKLTENVKLHAHFTKKMNEKKMDFMVSQIPCSGESPFELALQQRKNHDHQTAIVHCGPVCFIHHQSIPWYPILGSSSSAFQKLHLIKPNVNYKLWNPVKNGVIMFDPSTPGSVFTSGGLDTSANGENIVESQFYGQDLYYLVFNGSSTQYITAATTGTAISLTTNPTDYARFQPIYYWSYTMFRCNQRSTGNTGWYLGCNENDNLAVLVPVNESYSIPGYYPDPRTLFITNAI
ncbi:uncharacterized protein [Montipora capricornis]|uniref:uncharacterized protein isoform X2 n=1 Tax=Montipora capricornis TaxID=246305 RepID=UPI0035F21592